MLIVFPNVQYYDKYSLIYLNFASSQCVLHIIAHSKFSALYDTY